MNSADQDFHALLRGIYGYPSAPAAGSRALTTDAQWHYLQQPATLDPFADTRTLSALEEDMTFIREHGLLPGPRALWPSLSWQDGSERTVLRNPA